MSLPARHLPERVDQPSRSTIREAPAPCRRQFSLDEWFEVFRLRRGNPKTQTL